MNYIEVQQELANISNQVFMEYSQQMDRVGPHYPRHHSVSKSDPILPLVVEKIDNGMNADIFFFCHEGKTYSLTRDSLESFLNSESATTTINNISAELGINLDSLKARHSFLDITRMLINLDKRIGHYRESMLGYNLSDDKQQNPLTTVHNSKYSLQSVIDNFINDNKDSWSLKTQLKVKNILQSIC
jgi:hypothetical protein